MNRILARTLSAFLLSAILITPTFAAEPGTPVTGQDSTITWDSLEERIRAGSLNTQAFSENIQSIGAINYEKMEDDLRKQLNTIADAQWYMITSGNSAGADALDQTYDALRETFDDLRDGTLQEDHADTVRQLEDAIDQVVATGQSLYINLISMEQSLQDASRGLETLDRSLSELRLRQELGQVSAQTVLELEQTRAETVYQMETLESTIATYKGKLQQLMGEESTGDLVLTPLPELSGEELLLLNPEEELSSAKEKSWALRSAQITLDDAQEQWKEDRSDYSSTSYKYAVAEHTWKAAQLTYQAAVQDFETSFRTLYQSILDGQRAVMEQESTLAYQERQLELAQAKYELGQISYFEVLSAQDDLETARSAVDSARIELFTAYHNYQTAVDCGLING